MVADALSRRPDHMTANAISFATLTATIKNKITAVYATDSFVNDPDTRDSRFLQKGDLWTYDGKLYIPDVPDVRQQLLSEFHDIPIHGHLRVDKTQSGPSSSSQ